MYDAHNDVLPDYSAMREALGEKYVILNKLHPFVEQNKAQTPSVADSFVFTAKDLPIDVCLCAADLLISDYSSLILNMPCWNAQWCFLPMIWIHMMRNAVFISLIGLLCRAQLRQIPVN